jgi:hypothetical protein
VNSILRRDWIKGQVTAVECDGILSFEAVFPLLVPRR